MRGAAEPTLRCVSQKRGDFYEIFMNGREGDERTITASPRRRARTKASGRERNGKVAASPFPARFSSTPFLPLSFFYLLT